MKLKSKLPVLAILLLVMMIACNKESTDNEQKSSQKALENLNESGMPIVEEPIKLKMFVPVDSGGFDQWNNILVWDEYAKMTNIDVEWERIQSSSLEEKRNLALASGNLPDAFYAAGIPSLDLYKYGKQGTFIELTDLIDKYAPNLKKLMEEYPEVRKTITFPDGNIYALPTVISPDSKSLRIGGRPWIKTEWLDALHMDIPETTDDLYTYLKAVKEKDPNGNGEADEIPYGGRDINGLLGWLRGAYGISNRGPSNGYVDMDPKEEALRFFPTSDQNKKMLQFVHTLYKEGLIEQNIFSIDENQYMANATEGLYGSTDFYDPELLFGKGGTGFEGAPALIGPDGDQGYVDVGQVVTQLGAFAITKENANPEASIRWLDHFYSDEGAQFYFMGVEGETYKETNEGEYKYLDKIVDSDEGLTMEQELAKYVPWVSVYAPAMFKEKYFQGSESSPASVAAAETLDPYIPEEIWPSFTYTEEENKKLSALAADIEKYVDEMKDKFITGDASFDEWDNYVETIEKMGLDQYMEIKEAAYERYQSN